MIIFLDKKNLIFFNFIITINDGIFSVTNYFAKSVTKFRLSFINAPITRYDYYSPKVCCFCIVIKIIRLIIAANYPVRFSRLFSGISHNISLNARFSDFRRLLPISQPKKNRIQTIFAEKTAIKKMFGRRSLIFTRALINWKKQTIFRVLRSTNNQRLQSKR